MDDRLPARGARGPGRARASSASGTCGWRTRCTRSCVPPTRCSSVDGAGLMLTDAEQHLRSVAASDGRLEHLEELQIQHAEGPCIAAFEDKELVGVEDLERDRRWPKFSDAAVSRQVRAVLASPLPLQPGRRGRRGRGLGAGPALVRRGRAGAARLHRPRGAADRQHDAEPAAVRARRPAAGRAGLPPDHRAGQRGVDGRHGIPARTAFEQLRAQARAERRKIAAICAEVVEASAAACRACTICAPAELAHTGKAVMTPPRLLRPSVRADASPLRFSSFLTGRRLLAAIG